MARAREDHPQQLYRRRVSTDRMNQEESQLAASLEGKPGPTPAGKTLPHPYPKTRFPRERARDIPYIYIYILSIQRATTQDACVHGVYNVRYQKACIQRQHVARTYTFRLSDWAPTIYTWLPSADWAAAKKRETPNDRSGQSPIPTYAASRTEGTARTLDPIVIGRTSGRVPKFKPCAETCPMARNRHPVWFQITNSLDTQEPHHES